jgi:acetylornithine deacetylase
LHFDPSKPTILLCSHHDTVRPSEAWTRDPFDPAIESATESAAESITESSAVHAASAVHAVPAVPTAHSAHAVPAAHVAPVVPAASATPTTHAVPAVEAKLFGLGSNDAGASAVSMAAVFRHFYACNDLKYNLILALVAEEEISGQGGVRSILPLLGFGPDVASGIGADASGTGADASGIDTDASGTGTDTQDIATDSPCIGMDTQDIGTDTLISDFSVARRADFAIVGEPTNMQLAIAERGLMVLDCVAKGRAGHAARDEGDNAIYHAIKDIEWIAQHRFERESPLFGEVKMSVTMISAGVGHNVVPAECRFVVDCRVTEKYTNEEVLETVRAHVKSEVTPRSLHLRSSSISPEHPIVRAGISLGLNTFGSPTTSDQVALTAVPSVKIGPGQSSRSHSADEYILLSEIEQGIELYIKLLNNIL